MHDFTSDGALNVDEVRARLRKMDDEALLGFGKAAAYMVSPRATQVTSKPGKTSSYSSDWPERSGSGVIQKNKGLSGAGKVRFFPSGGGGGGIRRIVQPLNQQCSAARLDRDQEGQKRGRACAVGAFLLGEITERGRRSSQPRSSLRRADGVVNSLRSADIRLTIPRGTFAGKFVSAD